MCRLLISLSLKMKDPETDLSVTHTSFISEELFSRVTRLSTLPGSGLKQGWSGFRVFPSSGIHVCSHVSKKGVSPEGLGSDRITWREEAEVRHDKHLINLQCSVHQAEMLQNTLSNRLPFLDILWPNTERTCKYSVESTSKVLSP